MSSAALGNSSDLTCRRSGPGLAHAAVEGKGRGKVRTSMISRKPIFKAVLLNLATDEMQIEIAVSIHHRKPPTQVQK